MLLAIDIGNTNITIGVWDGKSWVNEWRLQSDRERTVDEFGITLTNLLREAQFAATINGAIISSVVPVLTITFDQLCQKYLNLVPLVVTSEVDSGIQIHTENPAEVGADRIANAVAAYLQDQTPCIVIDMGTATTFDIISKSGELLGVVIAPGLRLAADALATKAAKLSQVPLEAPAAAIGRNTTAAMQSGLIFGYICLIEGMVKRLIFEHPDHPQDIKIIGTGGLMNLISGHTEIFDFIDPYFTLTGLRLIYERLN